MRHRQIPLSRPLPARLALLGLTMAAGLGGCSQCSALSWAQTSAAIDPLPRRSGTDTPIQLASRSMEREEGESAEPAADG